VHIPSYLSDATKVIGYFSCTNSGEVCCDGDACVIAGTEEKMRDYIINRLEKGAEKDIIKKTRFGEIVNRMRQGRAYAFDEESYNNFYDLAVINGITGLPDKKKFLEDQAAEMSFVRIQLIEL
jgi:hypothetical protein